MRTLPIIRNGRRLSQRNRAICRFEYHVDTGFHRMDNWEEERGGRGENGGARKKEKEGGRAGGVFRTGWSLAVASSVLKINSPCIRKVKVGTTTREYTIAPTCGVYNSARRTWWRYFHLLRQHGANRAKFSLPFSSKKFSSRTFAFGPLLSREIRI